VFHETIKFITSQKIFCHQKFFPADGCALTLTGKFFYNNLQVTPKNFPSPRKKFVKNTITLAAQVD